MTAEERAKAIFGRRAVHAAVVEGRSVLVKDRVAHAIRLAVNDALERAAGECEKKAAELRRDRDGFVRGEDDDADLAADMEICATVADDNAAAIRALKEPTP